MNSKYIFTESIPDGQLKNKPSKKCVNIENNNQIIFAKNIAHNLRKSDASG